MPGESERYKPYRVDEEAGRHAAQEKAAKYGGIEDGSYTTGRAGDGIIRRSGVGESGRAAIRKDRSSDFLAQIKGGPTAPAARTNVPADGASVRSSRRSKHTTDAVLPPIAAHLGSSSKSAVQEASPEPAAATAYRMAGRAAAAGSNEGDGRSADIQSGAIVAAIQTPAIVRLTGKSTYRAVKFGVRTTTAVGAGAIRVGKLLAKGPRGRPGKSAAGRSSAATAAKKNAAVEPPPGDKLYRREQQRRKSHRPHSLRLLARGATVGIMQSSGGSDLQSKSLAVAAQTPAIVRQTGRNVYGAAKFGVKGTVFAGKAVVGAAKFAAKAPKRIYTFARNPKAVIKQAYNQVRQQIAAAMRRKRAQLAAKAATKLLPFLLGSVLILAPILVIVGQIPTITLKSTDEELRKVYLRITELDAELTRELRAIPNSAAYQSVDPVAVRFYINGAPAPKNFQLITDADYILKYFDAKYGDYAFDKFIYGLFGGDNVKSELELIHENLYSYTTQVWAEETVEPPPGSLGDPLKDIDPNDVWWYNANAIYSVFSVYLQEGLDYSKEQSDIIVAGALGKIQSESGLDSSQVEGFRAERGAFSAALTPQKWALFESEDSMDQYFHQYLRLFQASDRLIGTATSKFGRTVYAAPAEASPDVNTWGYVTAQNYFCGGFSYFQWTGDQAIRYFSFCKTNGLQWWTPEGALTFMFTDPAYGGDFGRLDRVLNDGMSWHDSIGGVETVSGQLAQEWLDRLQYPDRVCSMAYLTSGRSFAFSERAPGNWTLDYDYGRRILNKAASIRIRPAEYSAASIFREGDDTFIETPGETPVAAADLPYNKTQRVTHLDVYIEVKSLEDLVQELLTDAEAETIDVLDAVGMYTLKQELQCPFAGDDTWTVSRRWGKWCNSSSVEMHDGVDIRHQPDAEVLCVKTGVVQAIDAGRCDPGGSAVRIGHGDSEVIYGNLANVSVSIGDTVTAGAQIGTVSERGYLHLECWRGGQSVNPLFYLSGYYQSVGEDAGGVFTQAQQDIVDTALAAYADPGMLHEGSYVGCAAFVAAVYREAGYHDEGRNAINYWNDWQASGGTSRSTVPVGALVVAAAGGEDGRQYGHVGIYIGNGEVIHYSGRIWKHSFANFLSFCGGEDAVTINGGNVYVGYQGYCWPDGEVLGTYADETGC